MVSCPTTEGNLGDGYLPAMTYREAGVPLAIGSDSQVRIDPFEEARELETLSRRERELRAGLLAASGGDLWAELCRDGAPAWASRPARRCGSTSSTRTSGASRPQDLPLALVTSASAGVVVRQAA